MREDPLGKKSYLFAVDIVKLVRKLQEEKREFILTKQIIRSGTSIGALIKEAEFAQSPLDFINKLSISLKEANETLYWINLLRDTDYLSEEDSNYFKSNVNELISMLVSSIKTVKAKLKK